MAIPKQNKALSFGWLGAVDTQLAFSDFFHQDHTLAAWYMPQYPFAYEGPIFAENSGKLDGSGGRFVVGQGNYRSGDGGYEIPGSPVFIVQVGDRRVQYLLPEFQAEKWVHIALVRKNDRFMLFINGVRKFPVASKAPVDFGIAGSTGHVYVWNGEQKVSSGSTNNLGLHRKPYVYGPAAGKTVASIVGMAIAKSNDHVYAWYDDKTVSSGSSDDLDKHRKPYPYKLPLLKFPKNIVGMAISSLDRVYTWYDNQTVSIGSSDDLDKHKKPYAYSLPAGKTPQNIVGIAIDGADDHVYVWYDDNTFSSGSSSDLVKYSDPANYNGTVLFQNTSEVVVEAADINLPTGALRFGRRGIAFPDNSTKNWQAYGILDDVAVFDKALNGPEIQKLIANKRLDESEQNVIAAWTFDIPSNQQPPGPAKFYSWFETFGKVYSMPVSPDRDDAKDAWQFSNPFIVGETEQELRLPFKRGETWRVTQAYNDPGSSHNGNAAFCWDFVREDAGGTAFAPVNAATRAQVIEYLANDKSLADREANFVRFRIGKGEYLLYLHFADNSLNQKIQGSSPTPGVTVQFAVGEGPWIEKDEFVGNIGPLAAHLHMDGDNNDVTIPMAFAEYEVFDDKNSEWVKIVRGIPKAGQKIRRVK